ncbi:MAG: hypothetical protein ACI8PZ_000173 [Myxococcota bacterium]|jgi:hypothetical protein
MRAILAFSLLLLSASASAADWAGVPLTQLDALGLGAPTLSDVGHAWRAPLPEGGFVAVEVFADAEAAAAAFAARRVTASNMEQPELALGDAAVGDLEGYLLVQDGNVLVRVRSLGGGAAVIAERIRGALVATPPAGVFRVTPTAEGERRWDLVGREL